MRHFGPFLIFLILLTGCSAGAGGPTVTVPPTLPPISAPATVVGPVTAVRTGTPTTAAATAPPPTVPGGGTEYTVRPGDTLLGIAAAFDLPMAAIQLSNGMGDSTGVRAGKVLVIPPREPWAGASRYWVVHVVTEGETLVGIARAYDLDVDTLIAVNGLTDADLIRVGQELVLPLDGPAIVWTAAPTVPPPTATPLPSPTASLTPTVPPLTASPTPLPAAGDWPHEVARLINVVRARHGLPPLAYNETLAVAAQGHAADCAGRGWCSHTGSDGSDIKTRLIRAGYNPSGWAECWAQQLSPQDAVDIWMNEVPPNDPHRRTLLTTWLSEIGVGVAPAGWGAYFIADFGRP